MTPDVKDTIFQFVLKELSSITGRDASSFTWDSQLIGSNAQIKSRAMVELLLALEDFTEDRFGVEFDWSSDTVMSESRSILRSIDSLVTHLDQLVAAAKT